MTVERIQAAQLDDEEGEFVFDGIADIINNLKTPSWTVRDYIESDTHMLLFGESETLKSFLAVDIGLHVAAGIDWCGQPVKQGPVFYINGEGRGGFNRRVKAWCIANRIQDVTEIPFFRSRKPTRFYDENAALLIKKLFVDCRLHSLRLFPITSGILGVAQHFCDAAHQHQRPVMEGVHRGVDVYKVIIIPFPLGPIDNVIQLSWAVNGFQKFIGYQTGLCAD